MKICSISECNNKQSSKGFCRLHYIRYWRYGDPNIKKRNLFSGNASHYLYSTYDSMKGRCYNKNHKGFKNWGGRGIYVCDRWLGADGFTNFIEDMGDRPSGYTLDRIDNDGNYEPSNCRWASWYKQAVNKRKKIENVGVYFCESRNKYAASITVKGKCLFLGRYSNIEDAILAREVAEQKLLINGKETV